ncbi:AAA family ATPase [Thermotoga sp. KOL6]|uniref:AAA family ATPase n=1 Tax=Thermotoga sp. KOL6 TaxID=126741 RepID=UPI000C78DBBB|nr:MoxR family ATPase [Thermotoga sp. KOL6]PLV59734.1 AAA family ATPase [Thermotoga sp. KOL6]
MRVEEAKYLAKKIMMAGEIPLLVGHFGVGKTDIAKDIAKETGRDLIILVLSQMEPGDLIGLPARSEEKTTFLKPDWWPENGNTIVFLDEINRAHRSVRNAIMQLLVDKRIHNHVLPNETWIMAAMNPPEEEYDQADLITDPAFISRFFILEVNPNASEWLEWASRNGVSEEVRNFIKNYPEFLFSERNLSLKISLKPSPRSWYKLSNVLKTLTDEEKEKYGYILAAGIVGPEAAKAFYDSFFQKTRIPSVESVLLEGKVERLKDMHAANTLVLRIVDFLSKIDRETLEKNLATFSHNLIELSEKIPKESFYGILRFIVDESQKAGEKSDLFDKILERIVEKESVRRMVSEL